MGKIIDLTGLRFGRLEVLRLDPNRKTNNKAYWICKCDCGTITSKRGQDLRQGKIKSCGCYAKEFTSVNTTPDMIGERYGKLTVVKRVGSKNNHSLWLCKCDCGKEIEVIRDSLITGNTKSCGCLNSYAESIIEDILIQQGIQYVKQYTFSDLVGDYGTKLRFDFAIFDKNQLLYLIEFQGEQHFYPRKNDTDITFNRRKRYDDLKRKYCQNNNIQLIEIPYYERQKISWELLLKYKNKTNDQDEGFDWAD